MIPRPLFKDSSTGFQLFTFLFLMLFGILLGTLGGLVILKLFLGIGVAEAGSLLNEAIDLNPARILQITSQFGLFILPPLAFSWLFMEKPLFSLGFSKIANKKTLLAGLMLMFAGLPFIHFLAEMNESIQLPASLSNLEAWMKDKEEEAKRLTDIFLGVSSISGLMINLLMIAVIPALGEELVFRSVLQPVLGKLFRNIHFGIVISALVFSLMHFQFYGLIPRFVLGLFMGYFYYWSGSIWVPILMHFLNNGAAVIVYYLFFTGQSNVPLEEFGAMENIPLLILSIVGSSALLFAGFKWKTGSGKDMMNKPVPEDRI